MLSHSTTRTTNKSTGGSVKPVENENSSMHRKAIEHYQAKLRRTQSNLDMCLDPRIMELAGATIARLHNRTVSCVFDVRKRMGITGHKKIPTGRRPKLTNKIEGWER